VGKSTLYLPTETQEAVRALARRTGRSQADILREAIQIYVRQQARPQPRSIGAAEHSLITSDQVEDWLEANFRPA
jgi:predicted transcriptional regulator